MSTLYRGGKLGDSLVEALEVLINEEKISGELATEVLNKFDETMHRIFEKSVTAKGTLKGKLDVYRYIDNVWTFVLSDASIRVAPTLTTAKKDEEELKIEEGLKIVVVDSKVVKLRSQDEDADA